ncbi:MAG: helix-turn-helix transcriptional regulator, partial [Candidatus Heimdallarchaeota archaeon]|nr:helix-turn-helix transcriptional regulator [Candidatus Heimdallarchaeota archaeon]
ATRNSTTAYGSWSFDWNIGENNESFATIEFISNDATSNYNWTGLKAPERGLNGYGLVLSSYAHPSYTTYYPGVNLVRLASGEASGFRNIKFDSDQNGTKSIKIDRDSTGKMDIYYESELILSWTENTSTTSQKFMFTSWVGNSSIDNIIVKDEMLNPEISVSDSITSNDTPDLSTPDDLTKPTQNNLEEILIFDNEILLGGLLGLFSIIGTSYYITKSSLDVPLKIGYSITNNTNKIITQIFGNKTVSYFVIGQNFISKENINEKLEKEFPPEMLKHKYLMHPARLAICRVLIQNTIISSAEIRKKLDISWADFSNQIRSLKENELIISEDRIIDGSVKQVVSITPIGIEQYNKLISVLIAFIDESPMYHKYLKENNDKNSLDIN